MTSRIIALAGNPNVGKSTVFNNLTGLKQHTGNWTGKTVGASTGHSVHMNIKYTIFDLPGLYSLNADSPEEECARDCILGMEYDVLVFVADACALERSLILLIDILKHTQKVILCLNMMDEAEAKKIRIEVSALSEILKIPVVAISAKNKQETLSILESAESLIANEEITTKNTPKSETKNTPKNETKSTPKSETKGTPKSEIKNTPKSETKSTTKSETKSTTKSETKSTPKSETRSTPKSEIENTPKSEIEAEKEAKNSSPLASSESATVIAERIAKKTVCFINPDYLSKQQRIDSILTSKLFGIPIMLGMLAVIFFITIVLSNYPSRFLAFLFSHIENALNRFMRFISLPELIRAPIMDGAFRTTACVVAVMFPPMAIFFPLFTYLEDLGVLPRISFNLDKPFSVCGCSGKQCLTMCMGFGCNAVGITGARIIDSRRERLIAIVTNNFVPCNGRFPALIAISAFLISSSVSNVFLRGIMGALIVTACILLGILMTLLVSLILSKTLLKGNHSTFALELPPFRKPKLGSILVRSMLDRTLFVLARAVAVAVPAGLVLYFCANIFIADTSILNHIAVFLTPLGRLTGTDGHILTAFIFGFPANEIVMPIIAMGYTSSGTLSDITSIHALLTQNNWTPLKSLSVLILIMFHFPCATACLTIKKETNSLKWTLFAFFLPTVIGLFLCTTLNLIF